MTIEDSAQKETEEAIIYFTSSTSGKEQAALQAVPHLLFLTITADLYYFFYLKAEENCSDDHMLFNRTQRAKERAQSGSRDQDARPGSFLHLPVSVLYNVQNAHILF